MDMYQKREMRKNKKMDENTKSLPSTSINWYPGHMAKTRREISQNLDFIDVVYEVIDARMPISSKIVDIDNLIKDKPRILIVTKYDLCDKKVTDAILTTYKKEGYLVIPVDLTQGNDTKKIIDATLELAKPIMKKREAKGMKARRIRVLVVGVPNVGKSTLINRLVGKKATVVGNRPGVTKNLGWVRIHDKIELLDSPGILWPKFENQDHALNLASLTSIKEEVLNLEEIAIHILKLLDKYYPKKLEERYGVSSFQIENIEDVLFTIAEKRGALSKNDTFDYERIYSMIVKDVKDGIISEITFDRFF